MIRRFQQTPVHNEASDKFLKNSDKFFRKNIRKFSKTYHHIIPQSGPGGVYVDKILGNFDPPPPL